MDFSNSKNNNTATYPVHAQETSGLLKRCEPMLTPSKLISRYLKGIPLIFPNGDELTSADLKDRIMLAANEVEVLLKSPINRESFKDKLSFDRSLYESFIHLKTEQGPIVSLERLAIVSSNNANLFQIPIEWIETTNFSKRQINVIPLLAAFGLNQITGSVANAGIVFLTIMGGLGWVPAYWEVQYTAGLANKEGHVPIPVNELIGIVAAISVLSEIAPSNIYNSQSLSQDGISQSSSGPGPRVYEKRIEELEYRKENILKKLKGLFSNKFHISNI